MTTSAVNKEVLNFRKEYGIIKVNCSSLSEAAEKLGYTVIMFNSHGANDENVTRLCLALNIGNELLMSRGFTYSKGEFRLVFINENLSDKEKSIVLAHELGHIVLGHTGHAPVIGHDVQEEFEANEFASFLLKSDNRLFVLVNCHKAVLPGAAAIIVLLVIVISALMSHNASDKKITVPDTISKETTQNTESIVPADGFEDSELFSQIKMILGANLSTVDPEINYDTENHLINVVCVPPKGTHNALVFNKSLIEEDWNTLCDSLTGMSDSTYKLCLENGYKVGCTVMLVGDDDPDVCLFAAMNGMVYCDIGK